MLQQNKSANSYTYIIGTIALLLPLFFAFYMTPRPLADLPLSESCIEVEAENKRLKRRVLALEEERELLVQDRKNRMVANRFLREKNDELIEEAVPMRYWNSVYKKLVPKNAALEKEIAELRSDSIAFTHTIKSLKSGLQVELVERQEALAGATNAYLINDIYIKKQNDNNLDVHFMLTSLNDSPIRMKEEALIKMQVFYQTENGWEQLIYGEKGSESYDKYYTMKFFEVGIQNKARYHSINNFSKKKAAHQFRVEFYHEGRVIGAKGFNL